MLPLSAHFTMFEDKCIWYPDERSNYAFYDECLTKLLLITALLLFGVMSVSINIHRAARINKRRLNSERKHGGIWKRMRTLYVCIFAPLLASLCQHFLILGAVCCTLRICKLKTSSSSSLRTAERERRKKKSLPLNCLRWQKWHSGLNIYQLHEINELGEMQKKMTLWLFFKGALAPRRWCFWTARCSNVLRCAASRFDPALIFLPDTDSDTWTLCWHHVCLFRSAVNCREPIKNNKKTKCRFDKHVSRPIGVARSVVFPGKWATFEVPHVVFDCLQVSLTYFSCRYGTSSHMYTFSKQTS